MATEPGSVSTRSAALIAAVVSAVSGAGGALTVRAQDADQDRELAVLDTRVGVVEGEIATLRKNSESTRVDAAATRQAVKGLQEDMQEVERLLRKLVMDER